MQVSVRSYLTAGTVAVVGAGAIAFAPVLPTSAPAGVPAPAVAQVTLTGLNLSLSDILAALQDVAAGGGIPGIGGALPNDLLNTLLGEVVKQALPVLSAAAGEVLDYVRTSLPGLITGPDGIVAVLATVPAVIRDTLDSGNPGDVFKAIVDGPVAEVGQILTGAVEAVQGVVMAQLRNVVNALPGIVMSAIEEVFHLGGVMDVIKKALEGLFGIVLPAAGTPAGNLRAPLAAAAVAPAIEAPPAVDLTAGQEESVAGAAEPGEAAPAGEAASDEGAAPAAGPADDGQPAVDPQADEVAANATLVVPDDLGDPEALTTTAVPDGAGAGEAATDDDTAGDSTAKTTKRSPRHSRSAR